MMKAYIFPGQGSQFTGMGKDLFEKSEVARQMFRQANEIMGFGISTIMFEGSAEDLKQTKVTQPAVFIHSVISAALAENFKPDMVAGHSLGEFSALVANKTMTFEEALKLVSIRATAMQKACELVPSTMAAVLGMADNKVEEICAAVSAESGEVVVAANYNCPGQLVISGSIKGVELACVRLKEGGAKRALLLPVGGAFHSPLMEPARQELADAIEKARFSSPICPIYQNLSAKAETDANTIKANLVAQLTAPVRWTQSVNSMVADGATEFIEAGPGNVLQGLVAKINNTVQTLKV
jgi:[acyl-carrier-protein] S-malonyltransferase